MQTNNRFYRLAIQQLLGWGLLLPCLPAIAETATPWPEQPSWLLSQITDSPSSPSSPSFPSEPTGPTGPSPDNNQSDLGNPNVIEVVPPIDNPQVEVSRTALNRQMEQAEPTTVVQMFEEYQAFQYSSYFGWQLFGETTPAQRISQTLSDLSRRTGKKPALIYVISHPDYLELLLVLPKDASPQAQRSPTPAPDLKLAALPNIPFAIGQTVPPQGAPLSDQYVIRKRVSTAPASALNKTAREFRRQVSDPGKTSTTSYLATAQQLYEWIITPLLPELQANQIETLVFCLDQGLRSLPLAALHNGQQFLVEQYSLTLIPSFSLTDTRYGNLKGTQMLAIGISEAINGLAPLPAVAVEVPTLTRDIWQGLPVLNQEATIHQLRTLTNQQRFSIVHLATHGEFRPGNANTSFIQFWDGRLKLEELREVAQQANWRQKPSVDLLVLSACQTALGDKSAELGFTGLAVQAGVKTALGSLWIVSDQGSLGLMTGFYDQLRTAPTKAEALRQVQLAMLRGQIRVEAGQLKLVNPLEIPLPPTLTTGSNITFSHPYYWSAFTLVGNWN